MFFFRRMFFSFSMNVSASTLESNRLSRSFSASFRRFTFSTRWSLIASSFFDAYVTHETTDNPRP